jgi:hypothetical protein
MRLKIAVGILLVLIGIGVFILTSRIPFFYFDNKRVDLSDRNNFVFLAYPMVHDDGITVELIPAEGLSMDENGAIALTPDQVSNFNKLDPTNFKLLNADNRLFLYRLDVFVLDGKEKRVEIVLMDGDNKFFYSKTEYSFSDNKLKLEAATRGRANLGRACFLGCMEGSFIIIGLIMIVATLIKSIWPRPKKYSYLESYTKEEQNTQSGQP